MDETSFQVLDGDSVGKAARFLRSTAMLDYEHPAISRLVEAQGWDTMGEGDRAGAIYTWVRDRLPFGYNGGDGLSASSVLADGLGQCNTKTTLLLALLRAVGIPCRLHAATIRKELQHGLVNGLAYRLAPDEIIHTWAEVLLDGEWVGLEGVILDRDYLDGLRNHLPADVGELLGFGVGTDDLDDPPIDWSGTDTAIQSTGLSADDGVFDDPDSFWEQRSPTLGPIRSWIFRHVVRHAMNRNVAQLRATRNVSHPSDGRVLRPGGDLR